MGPPPLVVVVAFGPAVLVVIGLVWWALRDMRLALQFLVGLAFFLAVLAGAGFVLVTLCGQLRGRVGVAWRYGIANLNRRRADSMVQIAAFGAGLMVLLVLGVVRDDLDGDWRRSLPADAPNYFFVNIPPADRVAFTQFLEERGARFFADAAHAARPADGHQWPGCGVDALRRWAQWTQCDQGTRRGK